MADYLKMSLEVCLRIYWKNKIKHSLNFMQNHKSKNISSAKKRLIEYFERSGCVRYPDLKLRKKAGCMKYKKGWEVRFTAKTNQELDLIGKLLDEVGLKKGKPYKNGNSIIQPVYGEQAVEIMLKNKKNSCKLLPPPEIYL